MEPREPAPVEPPAASPAPTLAQTLAQRLAACIARQLNHPFFVMEELAGFEWSPQAIF